MVSVLFLGSNQGNRTLYLARARRFISQWPKTRITGVSRVMETKPEGFLRQKNFLNQALRIETDLSPMPLLLWAKKTEKELGRKTSFRWGPREIDIDILTYGRRRIRTFILTLPHPRLSRSPSMQGCLRDIRK